MKTAISISDPLFEEAERFSKRHKISRSRLYAQALAAYLKSQSASGVRERLDAVYGSEDSAVDAVLSYAQEASLDEEDWPCVAEKSGGRR
jgi:metal-responsive CopG/Arc/MetJ family transcriptional regulator